MPISLCHTTKKHVLRFTEEEIHLLRASVSLMNSNLSDGLLESIDQQLFDAAIAHQKKIKTARASVKG